jgi:hypothetical protein
MSRTARRWWRQCGRTMSLRLFLGALTGAMSAQAAEFQYAVGARLDTRIRSGLTSDVAASADGGVTLASGEVEVIPSGEATLGFGPTRMGLGYNPSILFRDLESGGRVVALHRGRLNVGTRWEGGSFQLTEDAAYGQVDFNPLRTPEGAPTGQGTTLPPDAQNVRPVVVPFARSSTVASADVRLPARAGLSFSAGFNVSGSLASADGGTPSATTEDNPLPLQYGPFGAVGFRMAATEIDSFGVNASVMQATFVTKQWQLVSQATAGWNRQLSRSLSTALGLGASYVRQLVCVTFEGTIYCDRNQLLEAQRTSGAEETPGTNAGWHDDVLPVLTAGGTWRGEVGQGTPLTLGAALRVAPFSDPVTAVVYGRLEGNFRAEWAPTRTVSLRGGLGAGYAFHMFNLSGTTTDTQAGQQIYSADLGASWLPAQWLSFSAGARLVWARQSAESNQVQWAGTLSVLFRTQDTLGL